MPSRKMPGLWQSLTLFAALALTARAASAQSGLPAVAEVQNLPGATLSVLSDVGAVGCPDAAELAEAIRLQTHVGKEKTPKAFITVSLEHQTSDYVAHINVAGRKTGERVLRVPGTDCSGLRDALVVSLALIVDEEAEPRAPVPPPPPRQVTTTVPNAPIHPREQRALALDVGAALTQGLPYRISGVLRADLEFSSGAWGTALGALWTPSKQVRFEPGNVDVRLWGGQARACRFFGRAPAQSVSVAFCGEGIVAKLTGQGYGYSSTQPQVRPWMAIGASASVGSGYALPLGWALRAVATFPLRQDAFDVNGIPGEAYRIPRVSLGLEALLRWRIL